MDIELAEAAEDSAGSLFDSASDDDISLYSVDSDDCSGGSSDEGLLSEEIHEGVPMLPAKTKWGPCKAFAAIFCILCSMIIVGAFVGTSKDGSIGIQDNSTESIHGEAHISHSPWQEGATENSHGVSGTLAPTTSPTASPTAFPTSFPTAFPTASPTRQPTPNTTVPVSTTDSSLGKPATPSYQDLIHNSGMHVDSAIKSLESHIQELCDRYPTPEDTSNKYARNLKIFEKSIARIKLCSVIAFMFSLFALGLVTRFLHSCRPINYMRNAFPFDRFARCLVSLLFKHFGADRGAVLKQKFLEKLKMPGKRKFVFVVAGSSSSAGADSPHQVLSLVVTAE